MRELLRHSLAWALLVAGCAARVNAADSIDFDRDVRPILSDHCFVCHGPDAEHRQADLRLDTKDGMLTVIEAGEPEQSELLRRIAEAEDYEQMPPKDFAKPLSPGQIDLIRRWIDLGAEQRGHWAFQPIRSPEVPQTERSTDDTALRFITNEIDRFTLSAMQSHGLLPAPTADPRTLVRRISFDLSGLPPDPDLVERFLANASPAAYQQLVDELLASPHFGERMAIWWLDLVRFADSVGYHGDQEVSVSPYRDYVIQSFNNNKRFDEFTIEQLAGDLLPDPTQEQKVASGYNRLGMMSAEGGVQPKEYLAKYIAERVRNLGGTWMGVTLGCCECHDHKYDPFLTRDFYSFEAFFADIEERGLYAGANASGDWGPHIKVPTDPQRQQLAEFDRHIQQLKKRLATGTPELDAEQNKWEQSLPVWHTMVADSMISRNGGTLSHKDDGSILTSGTSPATDTYQLVFSQVPDATTAIRIEAIPDDTLPGKGSGRAGNGNFVLTELTIDFTGSDGGVLERVKLQNPTATFEQPDPNGKNPSKKWAIAAVIDGNEEDPHTGWAIMGQVQKLQVAVIETAADITLRDGQLLTIQLHQNHAAAAHTIGRFRLSATTASRPISANQVPTAITEILAAAPDQRSPTQQAQLAEYYRGIAPSLDVTRKELSDLQKQCQQLDDSIRTTLVTKAVTPRTIRVLPRGNWMDESGEIVEPGFPASLSTSSAVNQNRLTRMDLAHWLLAPDNPLTARVLVNRLWKLFFGAGLSRKMDDVGSQGAAPDQPELLDYLATRLIQSGWNIKDLVRLMVLSGTYRQTSHVDPHRLQVDPDNRLLSRQASFRLDAEMVRDNGLAISGLLNREIGGRSIKPYQPAGYWDYLNFPTRQWTADSGAALYRRGLYVHWQRQYLHPSLLAFDAPNREECSADRPRSNTPLQALVLLNDPIFVEAARVFAERALSHEEITDQQRLAWAFRQALSRPPTPQEVEIMLDLLSRHRVAYRSDMDAAKGLISTGAYSVREDLDPAEWAAWTSVTRALLNLHETITRY